MVKVKRVNKPRSDSSLYGYRFHCPGCKVNHVVPVGEGLGPRWTFNHDPQQPTFVPSILIRTGHYVNGGSADDCLDCKRSRTVCSACSVCHSFVTNGQIEFLNDCTHGLAGQTVTLPEIEE